MFIYHIGIFNYIFTPHIPLYIFLYRFFSGRFVFNPGRPLGLVVLGLGTVFLEVADLGGIVFTVVSTPKKPGSPCVLSVLLEGPPDVYIEVE